jgi:predicted NAD/FAD-dependent oxidoreductase
VSTGLYACGDHLETPSINGALRSGRRAAEALLEDWGLRDGIAVA